MAHTREASVPRLPFTTPVMQQKSYRDPIQQTSTKKPAPKTITKSVKSQAPILVVIPGFDNPRTPPVPGHGFDTDKKHKRNASLQERRAAKAPGQGSLGIKRPEASDLSPSDGTLVIGFEEALRNLSVQPTSERTLYIQSNTANLVSPITPSIIVTGIPKDGEDPSDMFLRPVDPRHRSSIYSQSTNVRQNSTRRQESDMTDPPVPVIPHDMLDANRNLPHPSDSARISSWNTEFEDDDHSVTYVGSVLPITDDVKVHLIERSDTVATKYRSHGWWNTITTPFLAQRSAAIDKLFPRSPPVHSSKSSPRSSPRPSNASGSGHTLSEANIAALIRGPTPPAINPTTPHLADSKRDTIGFFGEATPKTATFPPVPPLPQGHQKAVVLSPEFKETGAFGEAAEYFEACWHDMSDPTPYYQCVNHDCSSRVKRDLVADARSRELFNASMAVDHANHAREANEQMSALASHSAAKELPALPTTSTPSDMSKSPSFIDNVQPSDSVSQVAERRVETAASRSLTAPDLPQQPQSVHRQTTFSDEISSPEVAEANAMPIMRAVTPEPMHVNETRSRSGSVDERAPIAKAVPVMIAPASASHQDIVSPVPIPPPASRVPYPESVASVPRSGYVPPPPPPPPMAAPYPDSPRGMPLASMPPVQETPRNVGTFVPGPARSLSPAAASHFGPPPVSAVEHYSSIGMARSMPMDRLPPTALPPQDSPVHIQHDQARSSPDSQSGRGDPTIVSSRNVSKRQAPPPLAVPHSPQPPTAASPGAYTPGMAREAAIGTAMPMQASQAPPMASGAGMGDAAPAEQKAFTRRGMMERYDLRHSSPMNDRTDCSSHTPLPPPPFIPVQHQDDSRYNLESSRADSEKAEGYLPGRPPKRPSKFALVLGKWREGRAQRTPKTKEQQKRRRCCCFIFAALFALVLLIVLLVMLLTVPRTDMPVQSSWLNLTNYPPIPTGVATIARPNSVLAQSGCVAPQTMWSCALPREQQDAIKPNAPDQPNFRFLIRFQNGTSLSNGTTVGGSGSSNKTLAARDAYAASLWNPNPAAPNDADQKFLGNTTDGNSAPFDGEETPFFISFLPTTTSSGATKRDSGDSDSSDTSSSAPDSAAASSSASSTLSSSPSPTSSTTTSSIPDILSAVPSPALNSDGTPATPSLYPLPTAQPLRLYNRNQSTEHYGFYTYFDRTIFLSSISPTNGTILDSASTPDTPGGAAYSAATHACTFSQTRFLVQIWTGGSAGARQLLNGSSVAEAAARGNITADSASAWAQPGSFPWPVTVTLDRHGGAAAQKMVYCYGLDGGKVNVTDKKIVLENRGFGGTLVDGAGGLFSNATTDPVDGGTGGCGCSWQNWQSA